MTPWQIEECLKSMIVLYDTREHENEKAVKRYKSLGCEYRRQHIDYGDYSYNFQIDGKWWYQMGEDVTVHPDVTIERKASLTELSNNLIQEKERFEEEFKRASDHSARIYLLVENGNLQKVYSGKYGTKVHPNAYKSSLWAIIARYKICGPVFVPEELSGKVIKDILHRELKHRLESGFYG